MSFLLAAVLALAPAHAEPPPPAAPAADHAGAIDPGLRADIEHLMKITGSADVAMQVMRQMLEAMKGLAPDVPPSFWDEFLAEVDPQEFTELMIPVYAKHFTRADIQELIRFYESPVGQKFIREQAGVTQDSMAVGQRWGEDLARRVMERAEAQRRGR